MTKPEDAVERYNWTDDYSAGFKDGHKIGEAFGHAAGVKQAEGEWRQYAWHTESCQVLRQRGVAGGICTCGYDDAARPGGK